MIILMLPLLFGLVSCTKQNGCKKYDNYIEGILYVLDKPCYSDLHKETICAVLLYDNTLISREYYHGIGITGGLPKEYKTMDTVRVGISFVPDRGGVAEGLPAYKIRCIEQNVKR